MPDGLNLDANAMVGRRKEAQKDLDKIRDFAVKYPRDYKGIAMLISQARGKWGADPGFKEKIKGFEGLATPERQFAPQKTTKYIPIEGNKFQLMSVDEVTGETVPVLKDGKPVVGDEKQVLIMEGKNAQSLINPYETKFLS